LSFEDPHLPSPSLNPSPDGLEPVSLEQARLLNDRLKALSEQDMTTISDTEKKAISLIMLPKKPRLVQTQTVDAHSLEMSSERQSPSDERHVNEQDTSEQRSEEDLLKVRMRQSLYLEARRKQKKQKIRVDRAKRMGKIITPFLLSLLLYFVFQAIDWRFSGQSIALAAPTELLSLPQIKTVLRSSTEGLPFYQISPQGLEKQLRHEFPVLDQVYVRRRFFPTRLVVTLVEKPAWGALTNVTEGLDPSHAQLLHWDNTITNLGAYPQKAAESILKKTIPVWTNAENLDQSILTPLKQITLFLNSQPRLAQLRYIDIRHPDNVFAQFDTFKVRIGALDGLSSERIATLFTALPDIQKKAAEIDYVDLRWSQQVILKMK
jgi:hypothetical protein